MGRTKDLNCVIVCNAQFVFCLKSMMPLFLECCHYLYLRLNGTPLSYNVLPFEKKPNKTTFLLVFVQNLIECITK